MSYLKLLNARRKSGNQPSMVPMEMTRRQRSWADQGICIECGKTKAGANSYICETCESGESIEDIRDELAAIRRTILKKPDA